MRGEHSFSLRAKTNNDLESISPPVFTVARSSQASKVCWHTKDTDIMNLKLFSTGDGIGKRGQSPGRCRWHLNYGFILQSAAPTRNGVGPVLNVKVMFQTVTFLIYHFSGEDHSCYLT